MSGYYRLEISKHMKTDISLEHSHAIFREMCKRISVDVKTVDFGKKEWFLEYEWTSEEEDNFRKWLGEFLRKHKYVGKGKKRGMDWGYYEAGKILMNYGWKTKK